MIQRLIDEGLRLPGRRRRLLRRHEGRGLRQALQPRPGADGGRRAHRGERRRSATPATSPCGRARSRASRAWTALGPRPAGLAHRMLRHEHEAARRDARHPRRRPRPAVPAPRERTGPERESYTGKPFARYWMHNGLLEDGHREDGRLGRQRRQRRRPAEASHTRGDGAVPAAEHALPQPDRVQRGAAGRDREVVAEVSRLLRAVRRDHRDEFLFPGLRQRVLAEYEQFEKQIRETERIAGKRRVQEVSQRTWTTTSTRRGSRRT